MAIPSLNALCEAYVCDQLRQDVSFDFTHVPDVVAASLLRRAVAMALPFAALMPLMQRLRHPITLASYSAFDDASVATYCAELGGQALGTLMLNGAALVAPFPLDGGVSLRGLRALRLSGCPQLDPKAVRARRLDNCYGFFLLFCFFF